MKAELSTKVQLIKTLQEESPAESTKIADKNKEIKNLKTRTDPLEDHINELQGKLRGTKLKLDAAIANHDREVELNNFFTRNPSIYLQHQNKDEQPPNVSVSTATDNTNNGSKDTKIQNKDKQLPKVPVSTATANTTNGSKDLKMSRSASRKKRGVCGHELDKKGTCPFTDDRCMFSHDITDEDRNNLELRAKV